MSIRCVVCIAGAVALAPRAMGQTTFVELRFVERTGQTSVTPADPVLDISVQARVLQGQCLNRYYFDVKMLGENDAWGALTRERISNLDSTYYTGFQVSNTVGLGGVARQYTFVALINSGFNGLINTSGGSFSNTSSQEIGLIGGTAWAGPLLGIPGVDVDTDGNPDTWSGNGSGTTPVNGATAAIDPLIAGPYLGRGEFIDIYRFRYTVTDFHARTILMNYQDTSFATFTEISYANGIWGSGGYIPTLAEVSLATLQISVVPSAPTTGLLIGGFAIAGRRRRRT